MPITSAFALDRDAHGERAERGHAGGGCRWRGGRRKLDPFSSLMDAGPALRDSCYGLARAGGLLEHGLHELGARGPEGSAVSSELGSSPRDLRFQKP